MPAGASETTASDAKTIVGTSNSSTSSRFGYGSRWFGLMSTERERWRLAVLGFLLLVEIALCFMPFASFANIDTDAGWKIGIFLLLAPIVIGSMLLGIFPAIILGVIGGIGTMTHALLVPYDLEEMYSSEPLTSIIPIAVASIIAAVILIAFLRTLSGCSDKGIPKARAAIVLLVSCLISALAYMMIFHFATAIVFPPDSGDSPIIYMLGEMSAPQAIWGIVLDTAYAFAAAWVVLLVRNRKVLGLWSRSMRAVFQRWLLFFLSVAFMCTMAVTYCIETVRAIDTANTTIDQSISYLDEQIDDSISRTENIKAVGNDYVLKLARAASAIIAENPQIIDSTETMKQTADKLGLSTLSVTDGNGMVVADSDGTGIGTFSFADNETTSKYMDLISGASEGIAEEPRESIDGDGGIAVFAGVPRTDSAGIVQISIPASAYYQAISSTSIEHLGDNYTIGDSGGIFILDNGVVATATEEDWRGVDVFGMFGISEQDFTQEDASMDLYDSENDQLFISRLSQHGQYSIVGYMSSEECYANRNAIMAWTSMFFLVLFIVVFALASKLLDKVVISGIESTNDTLDKITHGDLDQRVEVHSNVEFDSLSDGINTTVGALKDSISEASARIDRELATAAAIQKSALPRTFPPFPDIQDFDIFAAMKPAREVGGDFYDFFLIGEDKLGMVIADVAGKGIPASLFMMASKTEIENYMGTDMTLSSAVETINHRLCMGNDAQMFVTAFVAVLDIKSGHLVFVNAGHNPPLIRRGGSWEWMRQKSGLVLGIFDMVKYESFELDLVKGDELLLYTDGVTEAMDPNRALYGEKRLEELLAANADLHPKGLVKLVSGALAEYANGAVQADDITLMSLEYGRPPETSETITVAARVDELSRVLGFVNGELERRLCPLAIQKKLDIAVEEMFVNVANYAYPQATDENPGKASISYVFDPASLSITVSISDTGIPFNPLEHSDPEKPNDISEVQIGGLGIMMTRKCVNDIWYEYRDGHNVIAFRKSW